MTATHTDDSAYMHPPQGTEVAPPARKPRWAAPFARKTATPGMQIIRRSIQNQGLSEQSADIVLSAWGHLPSSSTNLTSPSGQHTVVKHSLLWSRFDDSIHSSVSQVLNFLTTLCLSGSGWSVTNTDKSAPASFGHSIPLWPATGTASFGGKICQGLSTEVPGYL